MICTCIHNRDYEAVLEVLSRPEVEMAEVRLDLCDLDDAQTEDLFANSDKPLIATCRISLTGAAEAQRRLAIAIRAGARFADVEVEAPVQMSKDLQKLCSDCGTELIRSYHDYSCTPSEGELQKTLARCFRYGADIAKIAVTCTGDDDCARVLSLYSIVMEDVPSMEGRLIAFGMGEEASWTRLECLRRSAPFSYACLDGEPLSKGQIPLQEMRRKVYGKLRFFERHGLKMPSSKSFAQRAIIAAAIADGVSTLEGYTSCDDSEAAIEVARALGAGVEKRGGVLVIQGASLMEGRLCPGSLNAGESGLLARMMIPLCSVLSKAPVTIEGRGTLLRRPLGNASNIMASFGVILKEEKIPLKAQGHLIPGNAEISGESGSQLISGLLMALPLCAKPSRLFVSEPKSIPYLYMTLEVLRKFGVRTRTEMEGDAQMLELQDWNYCTGIDFEIKGSQCYKACSLSIEADWSSAAVFAVAGAIFGGVSIQGMDTSSIQADLSIVDILVDAGAVVSTEDGTGLLTVRKAPLEAFECDLNHAPDLFPVVSVLAAFCAGESRISGVSRLCTKESDRAGAILKTLSQFGVQASVEGDRMIICGETLCSRSINGRLLKAGRYDCFSDHRMAMAIALASLGADGAVEMEGKDCVSKSFPDFFSVFC